VLHHRPVTVVHHCPVLVVHHRPVSLGVGRVVHERPVGLAHQSALVSWQHCAVLILQGGITTVTGGHDRH
jgi:hypothetical protein